MTGDRWDRRSLLGSAFLFLLGWALIALNTVRALQSRGALFTRVVETSIPFMLALVLVVGAMVVATYGLRNQALRISAWTVLGMLSVTAAVGLNIVGIDIVEPDGTLVVFMITNAAGGGAALGLLIGVYDAHQQQLKAELEREGEKARALSQRLSVVNRVLRHDIRNHAQVIEGYSQRLLQSGDDSGSLAEQIQETNRQLFETADSVRKLQPLLDGTELDCREFDLVASVREASETVQGTYGSLEIKYDVPDSQSVYGPSLLDQAIEQLLANAVIHNDKPSPWAEVIVERNPDARRPVALTIRDNGPGIPEGERLHNREDEETPLEHSSGLGLWFVKWIVDSAGGEFDIATPAESDVGTEVRLYLPETPP